MCPWDCVLTFRTTLMAHGDIPFLGTFLTDLVMVYTAMKDHWSLATSIPRVGGECPALGRETPALGQPVLQSVSQRLLCAGAVTSNLPRSEGGCTEACDPVLHVVKLANS
ncbi:hypothetical protein H1C71_006304 [Ictidomys tridecemlineatus]|nr:hypothetical protein H1C71_006304 [Ictidomys tridecemlineatus]